MFERGIMGVWASLWPTFLEASTKSRWSALRCVPAERVREEWAGSFAGALRTQGGNFTRSLVRSSAADPALLCGLGGPFMVLGGYTRPHEILLGRLFTLAVWLVGQDSLQP